jgi:hypothetical protein
MDSKTLGQIFIALGIMFGMMLAVGNGNSTAAGAGAQNAAAMSSVAEPLPIAQASTGTEPEYFSASGEGQFMANGQLAGGR